MQPKETTKLSQSSTVPWQMSHANIHYKEDRTLTSVRQRENHLPGICLESGGGWELPAAPGECARELKSCWRFPCPCKHRSFLQTEGRASYPLLSDVQPFNLQPFIDADSTKHTDHSFPIQIPASALVFTEACQYRMCAESSFLHPGLRCFSSQLS